MEYARFKAAIQRDEGFRSSVYLCSEGVATIGYGCTEYFPGDPVKPHDPPISKEMADQLLQADLWCAMVDAQILFRTFNKMNSVRQEVVCNMAFNLGCKRLAGFKRMIAACNALDWEAAADEMQDSRWYRQVGARAVRLCAQMRYGIIQTEF